MADNKLKAPMTKEERKLSLIENQKVKEKTFKLLVKIISWESGSLGSIAVSSVNKVTAEEWTWYKKHRADVFAAFDKEKAKNDLEKTFNLIKANGGFE